MLIYYQIPFLDIRNSLKENTGRVHKPNWIDLEPNKDFVRGFGEVRVRRKGGGLSWVDENEICHANNFIKFIKPLNIELDKSEFRLKNLFKHFYHDGIVSNKYEMNFVLRDQRNEIVNFSESHFDEFIPAFLKQKVTLKTFIGEDIVDELYKIDKHFSESYYLASLKTSLYQENPSNDLIYTCKPLIIFELKPEESFITEPSNSKYINLENENLYDCTLMHCWKKLRGKTVRVWIIQRSNFYNGRKLSREIRNLRLFLMRLHTEVEIAQRLISIISSKNINLEKFDLPTLYTTIGILVNRISYSEIREKNFNNSSDISNLVYSSDNRFRSKYKIYEHASIIKEKIKEQMEKENKYKNVQNVYNIDHIEAHSGGQVNLSTVKPSQVLNFSSDNIASDKNLDNLLNDLKGELDKISVQLSDNDREKLNELLFQLRKILQNEKVDDQKLKGWGSKVINFLNKAAPAYQPVKDLILQMLTLLNIKP